MNYNLDKNQVDIWISEFQTDYSLENKLMNVLSEKELKRAARFHFPIHRQRFIYAHTLLRKVLSSYLAIPAKDIEFTHNQHGKPFLLPFQNPEEIQFNLSHSENALVIGLTKIIHIGVDVEYIKLHDYLALAERFFSSQEYQELLALPISSQENAFFHIWTQKEAIIKAIGEGLHFSLRRFTVSTELPAKLIEMDNNKELASRWTVQSIALHDARYKAAYATPQQVKLERLFHL